MGTSTPFSASSLTNCVVVTRWTGCFVSFCFTSYKLLQFRCTRTTVSCRIIIPHSPTVTRAYIQGFFATQLEKAGIVPVEPPEYCEAPDPQDMIELEVRVYSVPVYTVAQPLDNMHEVPIRTCRSTSPPKTLQPRRAS